jgi:transposase
MLNKQTYYADNVGMRPKGTKKELESRRFHAVSLLEQSHGVREIARSVGVTPGAVSQWKKRYERAGKEGLKSKAHPGAKPRLSAEDKQALEELLLKGARVQGFSTELWTLKRVTKLIEEHFGVKYDPSQVWRILRSMKWSCQKPERKGRERDEEAIEGWKKEEWPRIKKSPKNSQEHRIH